MLCYLGSGERRYDEKPSSIHARPYWEFQAVLQGRIGMRLDHGCPELTARTLWLTAPGHRHGWIGEPQKPARVVVFHFLSIPELVKRRFRKTDCWRTRLSPEQCRRLEHLADSLADAWRSPRPDMPLRQEHLLLELSLIATEPESSAAPRIDPRRNRVRAALDWFHLNMHFNPSLDEVANAAGASAVHLRRLFHEVMQSSPKKVFDQLRFQRAIHLMTDRDVTLETVAEACGFQSASAFSRAFKQKFACSPNQWRGH